MNVEASATLTETLDRVETKPRRKGQITLVLLGLLLPVALLSSLLVGQVMISPEDAFAGLRGLEENHAQQLILALRLPRTVSGVLVGIALGVAGLLIQTLTRNPLADPGLIGVSAGASLAIALSSFLGVFVGGPGILVPAFIGALIITVVVTIVGLGRMGTLDPIRLILGGVAITAVLGGITSALLLLAPRSFDVLRDWNVGSLLNANMRELMWLTPVIVLAVLVTGFLARSLDALSLGEEIAAAQGVRIRGLRVLMITLVSLLAASATAIAGPIAFAALIIPHISRLLVGSSFGRLMACAILLGPTLLLVADVLGRVIVPSGEISVGVMIAAVGAALLIALIRFRPGGVL